DAPPRPFRTLAILLHRADVGAAERVLARLGYRAQPSSRSTRVYLRGETTIDLHWAIAPRCFGSRSSVAGLWVRRRPVILDELRLPIPAPEDHLLLLALHAGQHVWGRIGWLAAVAELLERHPCLDHAAVRYEARRHGIERLVRRRVSASAPGRPLPSLPSCSAADPSDQPRPGAVRAVSPS